MRMCVVRLYALIYRVCSYSIATLERIIRECGYAGWGCLWVHGICRPVGRA